MLRLGCYHQYRELQRGGVDDQNRCAVFREEREGAQLADTIKERS